jgi:uncharacterized protein (TIGR02646 family)
MMQLPDTSLDADVLAQLGTWQESVNLAGDYAAQVAMAKSEFGKRNAKGDATFDAVKVTLTQMCSGVRRCCYCEDSLADEVEHIQSKDLYPEMVFVWGNYLYACGPCNGPKNNKFSVFASDTGVKTDVTRLRNTPVVAPIAGEAVLINPRHEDPFDFMYLDVRGTFWFEPIEDDETTVAYQRAQYTIEVLALNRDALQKARRHAYKHYRAHLKEYIAERDAGADATALTALVESLRNMEHPSVWEAMKRFGSRIPELKPLFAAAPEALSW